MDANRFDDLARAASTRGSRRAAVRALAGVALGALGLGGGGEEAAARRRRCTHRCGGRCVSRCPDVMTRNRTTCECECPDQMIRCGKICVDQGNCCPGEKKCGGGCIAEDACCPYTHRECADGSCLPKDGGACCPGTDTCPAAPDGCCRPGEACADDGCCSVVAGESDVCGGKCVDLDTNGNCGACGNRCGACETCKQVGGAYVCAGPDRSAPACEDCLEGQVVTATRCGDHCCGIGAICCGNGCCAPGMCSVNSAGQTCCKKVIDNILYCLAR